VLLKSPHDTKKFVMCIWQAMAASGSQARVPDTTSSPWALMRKSPYGSFAPVDGLRVKATPVPDDEPMFPYTIA
jgi:hypothetical protein